MPARKRTSAPSVVDALTLSVERLLGENRTLRQRLRQVQGDPDLRPLSALVRQVERALGSTAGRSGRAPAPEPVRRRRRSITDPEQLERRRAALAKARAARTANLAAARDGGASD